MSGTTGISAGVRYVHLSCKILEWTHSWNTILEQSHSCHFSAMTLCHVNHLVSGTRYCVCVPPPLTLIRMTKVLLLSWLCCNKHQTSHRCASLATWQLWSGISEPISRPGCPRSSSSRSRLAPRTSPRPRTAYVILKIKTRATKTTTATAAARPS